jgi:acyl-CoA reductase-like NAD-dependent aldehyde dehydrogenase
VARQERKSSIVFGSCAEMSYFSVQQNAATEELIAKVPVALEKDVEAAVSAAKAAQPAWGEAPASVRSAAVRRFADLFEQNIPMIQEVNKFGPIFIGGESSSPLVES